MSASASASLQQRISEQLQALSQVGETLTLRLLELEERLSGVEQQIEAVSQPPSDEAGQWESNEILAATEERIARLEDLLADQQPRSASVVTFPERSRHPHEEGSTALAAEPELDLNPFPEEEEQTFMDELSA
jgi:hypothetical protein